MEKETKIVLLTHGGWGEALVGSLGMILGSIDCVHEIALKPSYTLPGFPLLWICRSSRISNRLPFPEIAI